MEMMIDDKQQRRCGVDRRWMRRLQLLMEQNWSAHYRIRQGGANTLEKLASLDEAIIQGILAESDESSKTTSWKTKSRARLLLKAIRRRDRGRRRRQGDRYNFAVRDAGIVLRLTS